MVISLGARVYVRKKVGKEVKHELEVPLEKKLIVSVIHCEPFPSVQLSESWVTKSERTFQRTSLKAVAFKILA
ncbi:unnamed protein product [Arabis nemorensis]|uniref:Uncharacterized protein n=1 Tax=Arabis nemorensis TaxID=586526 RepID=A0A565CM37_9BRAS|nr:unnamed protein product [Arabis nemorensis]